MADEAPGARRPNRVLAIVLLSIQVLGGGLLLLSSFWAFFHDDRETGLWHMSIGTLWFLFFGWAARAAMRPGPSG